MQGASSMGSRPPAKIGALNGCSPCPLLGNVPRLDVANMFRSPPFTVTAPTLRALLAPGDNGGCASHLDARAAAVAAGTSTLLGSR